MASLRDALIEAMQLDAEAFRRRLPGLAETHRLTGIDPESAVDPRDALQGHDITADSLTDFERRYVARMAQFETAPLGLTLTGPAYQDNPLRYATQTFRELTGYSLSALCGENLRVLQGPATESGAVARLQEGIDIWEQRTVELWNYRADGTRFRNRVTVVPLTGTDGAVTNWLGVQEDVTPASDRIARSETA